MLRFLRPQRVICVVGYLNEGLILAAKKLSIPVVEIQHGTISKHHIGYSVPEGFRKKIFPDELWLFGRFWIKSINWSVPIDRIKIVGYPYFCVEKSKLDKEIATKNNQIIFISQGSIGHELSEFAFNYAKRFASKVKVIYKLHPGEFRRWKKEYKNLYSACIEGNIEVVENSKESLHALLKKSKWQIGVYSTAIYEGLSLGCTTYLVDLPGISYMEDLINSGYATKVKKPQEISLSPENSSAKYTIDFFNC